MTLEERRQRMKNAGIPMPITKLPISEGSVSAIPVTAQNADKHARLQALKSGANKQQVQSLVKSTSKQAFQGLPEVKQKRRPQGQTQESPVQKVAVETNFGNVAPISGELAAIEAMMGGGGSVAPSYNPQPIIQNNAIQTTQPELAVQEDGYGPTFDPVGMLAKKRQQVQGNQYMKFAQKDTIQQAIAPLEEMTTDQQNFSFQQMKQMMEQIAKNTISEVLTSYTEKNKDKLTYENVNVKTSDGAQVIKTQDGKYYKLIPVKVKNG